MTLINKIIIALALVLGIGIAGFIIYKQVQHSQDLTAIQKSIIEQKQLLDNIDRAQAQYASKEDIEAYAKQQHINLDVISQDLAKLGAQVQGINGTTIYSVGQKTTDVPSTTITPRPDMPTTPPVDSYGYLTHAQTLAINENFSNVQVPFGAITFKAWEEKPWNLDIQPRKYSLSSILGQDDEGRHTFYSKFSITTGDTTYDVKIDDSKFMEELPKDKFYWWNPRLYMLVNGGVDVSSSPIRGKITPGVSLGIMSYGKKPNPTFSILQVGAGLGVNYGNKPATAELIITPIQYNLGNLGNNILIRSTYVGPSLQVNTHGDITPSLGLSVGF